MKKRLLSILLAAVMVLTMLPLGLVETAWAASSGTCGDKLTWSLSDDGTLTISGTGKMKDYGDNYGMSVAPWYVGSSQVKTVIIEDGVTSIGDRAFDGCTKLTRVVIPDSVTSIGYGSFRGCYSLPSVAIPDSVTSIGDSAFAYCKVLTGITLSGSVTSIGSCAFQSCDSLTSVTMQNGVTDIGDNAFTYCKNLTSVTIPNSVKTIGTSAFYNCAGLTRVTIPSSVTRIEQDTFKGCSGLTSVTISAGVTSIESGAFRDCTSLTSVTIPGSVTSIEGYAFAYCSALTSLIIHDGTTSIGISAFMNCTSLGSVTIPRSVTDIGGYAFGSCRSLADVYYGGTETDWTKITIGNGNGNLTSATLHCAPAAPVVRIGNSATSGKPVLTWNAVYGATSYRIYRSTSKGSGYSLLGKRVDYSGRSVIVVGPELKIYQCGVPKEMAVELFRPFIMKKLVEDGSANNIKSAKKMVDKGRTEVWDALDEIIKDHPVMLNRAPTLHRLGIQAFEPVLVEGRALKLHPLNCTAFNADFDGDQMAIHVPLSAEAQAEARLLMLSANNLLRPQDGGPVTVPTQDMVLGSYYLTFERFENGCCQMTNDEYWPEGVDFALAGKTYDELTEEEKASVHMNIYRDEDEALMAYNEHIIGIHQPIWVRVTKELNGVKVSHVVRATAGRIIFNRNIPQDLGFVKRFNEDGTPSDKFFDYEITETCGKKLLGKIVDKTIKQYGFTIAAEVLDNIKATGYKYSTRGSITISIADMTVPKAKYELIDETEKRVVEIEDQYNMGFITDEERYKLVVREWEKTTADVTDALTANMNKYNPIFMMADSGARGSMKQIRQLTGMRGLMANTAGKTIEIPIKANFREGLSVLEYFTSSRGARKGLADTALRTADSGYLTRRMVDVCQDVIIREADCGVEKGIVVSEISEGGQVIEKFSERIKGRFPVRDILKPGTDEVLISKDHMMTEDDAALMESFDIHSAEIRTVLTCRAHSGICAKCYGMNLATSKPVGPGEAVGIIAAQSIGEPGTQLTMRTFHTGGVAGGDITQGLPRVEELFEARKPKKMATIAEIGGKVRFEEATKGSLLNIIITADDGDTRTYAVPHTGLLVQDGEVIEKGRQLQDGALNPHDVLRIRGASAVHNYLIQEVLKVYRQQGVDINDKHIEVIVRQMMRKVRVEDANDAEGLLSGAMADVMEVEDANAAVRARIAAGEKREDGEELQEATYTQLLMGITKASLATDSFLSAASFQETTKVLTEAAIKGKVDHLVGLKENVIIGKLIPAGAGLTAYRQLAEEMVPETEAEKKDEAEAMHTEVPTPVEAPADMDEAELPESDGPETDTGDAL